MFAIVQWIATASEWVRALCMRWLSTQFRNVPSTAAAQSQRRASFGVCPRADPRAAAKRILRAPAKERCHFSHAEAQRCALGFSAFAHSFDGEREQTLMHARQNNGELFQSQRAMQHFCANTLYVCCLSTMRIIAHYEGRCDRGALQYVTPLLKMALKYVIEKFTKGWKSNNEVNDYKTNISDGVKKLVSLCCWNYLLSSISAIFF